MKLDYIYGYHPVMMALEPDSLLKVDKVFVVENKFDNDLKQKLTANNMIYEKISLQDMNNLLKTTKHQSIAAQVKSYEFVPLEQILKQSVKNLRILILDRISDPYNFGSMLRIAAGNDFNAVIILNRNQAVVNSVVVKASAGAVSIVPIVEVNNLTTTITKLQEHHQFWILAAAKNKDSKNYQNLNCDSNLALIIGNEGEGISPKLLKHADIIVEIPMSEKMESFNASVACGIIANFIYCKSQ